MSGSVSFSSLMNGDSNGSTSGSCLMSSKRAAAGINGNCTESDGTPSSNFVLELSGHGALILDKMNTLRKNKQFCDVILQVGSQQDVHEIYAHRAVLASASNFFMDMFTRNNPSTPHGTHQVQLYKLLAELYDVESFELLVEYMYTSRLEVRKEKVKTVYALASRLKMVIVAYELGQFLASTLTPENCLLVRAIPGVLADPILLNTMDAYIKQNVEPITHGASLDGLPKVKVEVIYSSREERAATNEKLLLGLVLEWIRKSFDMNGMDVLTEKIFLLYLDKSDKSLHDCTDIENGDTNCTAVIQDYKRASRKHSFPAKSNNSSVICPDQNGKHTDANGSGGVAPIPPKPQKLLFTRSDSDSSLSSAADDDDNDWKVLGTHQTLDAKHSILGLVTIAGKVCLLNVKLRVNQFVNPEVPEKDDDEELNVIKQENVISLPTMSTARCAAGAASFQGKLFACGGYDRGECLKSVEVYDSDKNGWTKLCDMREARGRFDVAVLDDFVYAVGGSDGQKELSSAEVYDPHENIWKELPDCPPPARSNAGVCCLNGKIYVVGGWNGQRGMQRCDVFDPQTEEWTQVASLQSGRYQSGVASMNGQIYAVGGCDSWTCLNTVEKYNPESNTWRPAAPLSIARRGCGVAAFDNKLYVVAGHDGVHSLNTVEIYDPITKSWSAGPPLNTSRANVGVAVVGNRIYAMGGFTGKTFLNTIEFLEMGKDEWHSYVPTEGNQQHQVSHDDKKNDNMTTSLSDEPLIEVEESPDSKNDDTEVD